MATILIEVDLDQVLDRNVWTALVRFRAGYKCEECGASDRRFHAHHVNEDDRDNRLANGVCLCVKCHGARHPRWRDKRWDGATLEDRRRQLAPMLDARRRLGNTARKCQPGCTCGKHRGRVYAVSV